MITTHKVVLILRSIADILSAVEPTAVIAETLEQTTEPEGGKPKGRPRKNAAAAAAAAPVETPATPTPAQPLQQEYNQTAGSAEPTPSEPAVIGMTREQLVALINPAVVGDEEKGRPPQGLKVKEIMNKYAPKDFNASLENQYTLTHLAEHPEYHAAFKKDILALINGTSAESY